MKHAILILALASGAVALGPIDATAQATARAGETFTARLSVVPIDAETARTTSGTGAVTAVLIDDQLFLTGAFDGMSSAAIAAHIHQGSPGQRGPIAFQLSVSKRADGLVGGGVRLAADEIQTLRDGGYYVQIHSEASPGGELRGWIRGSE